MSIQDQTLPGTFEKYESNVRGYSRQFPFLIASSKGSTITSAGGEEYLDFFAGAGGLNYGHNQADIVAAMIDYLQKNGVIHALDMATEAKQAFIEAFVDKILRPRGMESFKLQFTGPTGTNVVEAAFKLARKVTGKTEIISFTNGFHGVSLGALAATANPHFRNAAGVPLEHVTFFAYDDPALSVEDAVQKLRGEFDAYLQSNDAPAGAIVEAIQGEGGINAARPEWLQALRALTEEHGVRLILDDIQAGCGRSGTFFAFEEAGITPDMVCLSKSISGSGLPMGLLLIQDRFDVWKPSEHNGTFRGNNLAFVSARVAVDVFWSDDTLAHDVQRKAGILSAGIDELVAKHPGKGLRRKGRGMMQGIHFDDPQEAARVGKYCFDNNLVIERAGVDDEVVKFLAPLTTTDDEIRRGLSIIADAIAALG
jgi:diaminobutyrate-2-oxoglutarate transaminase